MEFDLKNPKVIAAIICTLASFRRAWSGSSSAASVHWFCSTYFVITVRRNQQNDNYHRRAPAAIGPYVQGVNSGTMTMTSGQLPVNPQDGTMSDDIASRRASRWKTLRLSLKRRVCR
jgi:hypothetical protein